jgi:Tfp pilus assembly protein FimT
MELVVVLVICGLLASVTYRGLRAFSRQQHTLRAAQIVAWELRAARSLALRSQQRITVVVDEGRRTMLTRTAGLTVLRRVDFAGGGTVVVDSIRLDASGDTISFSGRGFCASCAPGAPLTLRVHGAGRRGLVEVEPLGRVEVARGR